MEQATANPKAFMSLLARLVPTQVTGKDDAPLFADLSALPPVLIQVGEQDLLRIDASRLRDALMTVSANVTLHTMPASWHLFQLHAGVLSRATAAVSRAGDFIADAIRAQNAQTSQT